MRTYSRLLQLPDLLEKKSHFLLGPRATGKSYLIRQQLEGQCYLVNLLKPALQTRLMEDPGFLAALVHQNAQPHQWVVIDEVQKIPELLDVVQDLIESEGRRFLLTGSSARKLKRQGTNLLAGRAWRAELFPLVYPEIPDFDLARVLRFGSLPVVYSSLDPTEELDAYVGTYLKEEIQQESLVRRLPSFARFLKAAALSNGQIINYAAFASDTGTPASTVKGYFEILEDTLLGFKLEPWMASKKRKAIQTSKFLFFDVGVTHALAHTETLDRNTDLYGRAFEHWLGLELRAYLSYSRSKLTLTYWRTVQKQEVDFLMGSQIAIEVKATQQVNDRDLKGLIALREEGVFKKYYLVTQDEQDHLRQGVHCLNWKTFLSQLWGHQIASFADWTK